MCVCVYVCMCVCIVIVNSMKPKCLWCITISMVIITFNVSPWILLIRLDNTILPLLY